MKTWSFYRKDTGAIASRRLKIPESSLSVNTPADHVPIEGAFDHLSQRVDLSTGQVVDYRPPKPGDDYEWRENVERGRPRWVKVRR